MATHLLAALACFALVACAPPKVGDSDAGGKVECLAGQRWIHVAAGADLTCGVREDGCAECWGREEWAYDGYNPHTGKTTEYLGEDSPPAATYTQLSMVRDAPGIMNWDQQACGLTDTGEILCWGSNDFGESEPPPGAWTKVVVDTGMGCGLSTDGTVACWGVADGPPEKGPFIDLSMGGYGFGGVVDQAGDFHYWDARKPSESGRGAVDGPYVRAAMGVQSCATRTDGTLDCFYPWRDDGRVFEGPDADAVYTDVCMDGWHGGCGIREGGAAECWFDDWWEDLVVPTDTFTQVACGFRHYCGLTDGGAIRCWGEEGTSWLAVPP